MYSGSDPFPFISQAKSMPSNKECHEWWRWEYKQVMQSRSHLTEEVLTCLGVVIPAQVRRPCYQGRCAHTTRACKHQAPPTQNQSWHLKSFTRAYHSPVHFYKDRFAKTCHFQYYLFKRKKCHSLIKGLLRSEGLF